MFHVLILGGDSDFNLGDAAILAAVCHCLAATAGRADIVITSSRPRRIGLPETVRVIPRGARGLRRLFRAARASDVIVVGGGGLFQDDDSRAKMPYWAARIAALRLLNDNIVGHCVGAGPLEHAESRRCARLACSMLRSISVRDEFARGALTRCTDRSVDVVPDPAFMLPPAPANEAVSFIRSLGLTPGRPIIGVALRRWFHRRGGFIPHRVRARVGLDRGAGDAEMQQLASEVASALRSLARRQNAAILLLPTYVLSHEGDVAACHQLQAALGDCETRLALIEDPALYKAVAGHLTLMVSARMHPLIFAASMGVPIVGLAYNGKFEGLFDLLGVPRRLVWLNEFATGPQQRRLEELATAAIEDQTDLRARSSVLADAVYQRTAALLTTSPARAGGDR
jgi:polysaccharide pyruvyl transferase WcaK-like protein